MDTTDRRQICSVDIMQKLMRNVLVGSSHICSILIDVCVCFLPIYSGQVRWDVPVGVTQEEGHTGFLIHLPSAVHAFVFLVDREVEFCVLTI